MLYLFYFIGNSVFLPLQKQELAKDLGPLLEPSPVGFSMNTIGWEISFGILIICLISFTIFRIIHFRRNKYRRIALQDLKYGSSNLSNDNEKLINLANLILKRVAIDIYGRNEVASLYGKAWTKYLDSKSKVTRFEEYCSILNAAAHNLNVATDADSKNIIFLTKKWILTHAR